MKQLQQNRDPFLRTTTPGTIGFYEREFYPLSNFSSFQIEWSGILWPTSEHAYHGAKFVPTSPELVALMSMQRSAHDVFKASREHNHLVRTDWLDVRVPIMRDICRAKLIQHAYIRSKLLQTEDHELVEDSPKDPFWGIGADGQGENHLGTIWMKLREELRDGEIDVRS